MEIKKLPKAETFLRNLRSKYFLETSVDLKNIFHCEYCNNEDEEFTIKFYYWQNAFGFISNIFFSSVINKLKEISLRELKIEDCKIEILSEADYNELYPKEEVEDFSPINIGSLGLPDDLTQLLKHRWAEIGKCYKAGANLSTIILSGSFLEGILLGIIELYPQKANSVKCTPMDSNGKPKNLKNWTLQDMISVVHEMGCLQNYTQKLSDNLRDFRNLVHPNKMIKEGYFLPTQEICKIVIDILNVACNEIASWVEKEKINTYEKYGL